MRCDDALAVMLAAELAELSCEHRTPLGRHLADCARCRRVAEQLRDDSAHLAAMVAVPRLAVPRAPVRIMPWIAGTAAATALALVLRTPSKPDAVSPPSTPSQQTGVAMETVAPPVEHESPRPTRGQSIVVRRRPPVARDAPRPAPVGVSPVPVVAVTLDAPKATLALAFDPPTAVASVPLHATPTQAVVVATTPPASTLPPPNTDVTVVPSRSPGVTALWFN